MPLLQTDIHLKATQGQHSALLLQTISFRAMRGQYNTTVVNHYQSQSFSGVSFFILLFQVKIITQQLQQICIPSRAKQGYLYLNHRAAKGLVLLAPNRKFHPHMLCLDRHPGCCSSYSLPGLDRSTLHVTCHPELIQAVSPPHSSSQGLSICCSQTLPSPPALSSLLPLALGLSLVNSFSPLQHGAVANARVGQH